MKRKHMCTHKAKERNEKYLVVCVMMSGVVEPC